MHRAKLLIAAMMAAGLAACATQGAMTVDVGSTGGSNPKYRNAVAVRTVSGGQPMNVLTVPGVPNEPFKAALESSLEAKGYLANGGAARFHVDAEIQDLEQPLIGLTYDVTASVKYRVSGPGVNATYPITTKASASMSDSPIGADRMRIANERAMQQNIRQFLVALK
jgi:hypothetical protein